jgi:hypothetical protein
MVRCIRDNGRLINVSAKAVFIIGVGLAMKATGKTTLAMAEAKNI